MSSELLSSDQAARQLGISVSTLYDWLAQSDAGKFEIRAQPITIEYFQGGRCGQGRIKIDQKEVKRLLSLMRVSPKSRQVRQRANKSPVLKHITTELGRPEE